MTTEAHRCCVVRESWPEQIEREARERIARGFQTADDRAAAVRSELWMPGQTIHVSFMRHGATAAFLEAPDAIEAQVRTIANEWTTYANLSFAFDDSAAGIRISFRDDGSWSLLGRRCLAVRRDEATMNFGWLSRRLDPGEFRRVVLQIGRAHV